MIKQIELESVSIDGQSTPDFEEIVDSLARLYEEIEAISDSQENTLLGFYYGLTALLYNLVKITLSKFPHYSETSDTVEELRSWFFGLLQNISYVRSLVIHLLTDHGQDDLYASLLEVHGEDFITESYQWTINRIVSVAQWLSFILKTEYRCGNPVFYIYIHNIENQQFPSRLPRLYESLKTNHWLSGFGGKLLVPTGALNLTDLQKAELWNKLLVEEDIYGDETINHSVRNKIFEAIYRHFPNNETRHLDLCGGKGDFVKWLESRGFQVDNSLIIDNADKAIAYAQKKGIQAIVGSAENELVVKQSVDVVTIIFAIQWISANAFTNILKVLKPGGFLLANVYPPDLEQVVVFTHLLKQAGFINIEVEKIDVEQDKKQYLLKANKPND